MADKLLDEIQFLNCGLNVVLVNNLLPIRMKSQGEGSDDWNGPLTGVFRQHCTTFSLPLHPSSHVRAIFSFCRLTLFLIWIAFNYVTTKNSSTKIAAATYPLHDSVISSALRLCLALKSESVYFDLVLHYTGRDLTLPYKHTGELSLGSVELRIGDEIVQFFLLLSQSCHWTKTYLSTSLDKEEHCAVS